MMPEPVMELTEGHLLGGRVRYAQPARGFRSGIEPILLAAAIPLRPGERVLEGGSGAGAMLLCAAERVPDMVGRGIERDPDLVRLARFNTEANNRDSVVHLVADVLALPVQGPFDHACANPPYHAPSGTRSPQPARERAKRGCDGLLAAWARALATPLRHRGTLTFILPSGLLGAGIRASEDAGCAIDAVFPLWPKPSRPAKLVLIQAIKGGRGRARMLPGLILHREDGGFTAAASAVLAGTGRLDLT